MVQLTPIDEPRPIFAIHMDDGASATALHQDTEAAISRFKAYTDAERLTLALMEPALADASRRN